VIGCHEQSSLLQAGRLYASPFTDIHAQGPEGVFTPAKVDALFSALDALQLKLA
jgi:type I restriction enzyme R subunit